jgi:hypothetical protein
MKDDSKGNDRGSGEMKWESIASIPRNDTEILIRTKIGIVSAWYSDSGHEWVCYDDGFAVPDESVLEWMPIPAAIDRRLTQ